MVDALIGELIKGRFRVVEEIGAGATAIVYRAFDEIEERPVAIKILDEAIVESRAPEANTAQKRFGREARIILHLEDLEVTPQFIHASLTSAPWYIAMELVEGISLRELMTEHPQGLPAPLAMALIESIARGLDKIHAARVLHRDLAPDNIAVTVDADDEIAVRFLDFGIGRPLEAELDPVTKTTTIAGTPQYLAPEQTRGLEIDAAADVYALGCLCYEMTSGAPPIPVRSIAELARIRREIPEPLESREHANWVPPELAKLVDRCLAKAPEDRPSVRDLLRVAATLRKQPEWHRSGTELLERAPDPSQSQTAQFEPDQLFGAWRLLYELHIRPESVTWCGFEGATNLNRTLVVFDRDPRFELQRLETGLAMKERPQLSLSVPSVDSIIVDGHVVWVQDFVEGETLENLLAGQPEMDENRIIQIVAGLSDALQEIHAVNSHFTHGLLASSQVLLDEFDGVHLLNAGRHFEFSVQPPFQESGGDLPFLAPERQLGESPSQSADIWSFGAIIYHLLSGQPPFDGPPMAVAWSQWNRRPTDPLANRAPSNLKGLRKFALSCLARDPSDRPQPGRRFSTELDRALAGG